MNEKVLVVIPARSGSKGIPDKNIIPIAGKPLVFWSIDTAIELGYERIVVSTDSQKYADLINKEYGDTFIPFLRPKRLAQDTSTSAEVIIHAINQLEKQDDYYDIVLLLEPTSPFRKTVQIQDAINKMIRLGYMAVVSVYRNDQCHPTLAFREGRAWQLVPYSQTEYTGHPRRQDLLPAYFMEGSFYASYIGTFKQFQKFTHDYTMGYCVGRDQADELDEPCDIKRIGATLIS